MHTSTLLLGALSGACISLAAAVHPKDLFGRGNRLASRIEKKQSGEPFVDPVLHKRAERFLYPATEEYAVNGSGLPLVDFDIGESYAGLMPVSDRANETRELFFWFFPSTGFETTDQVTVWLNGGPGCSSMSGMLNGISPLSWMPGTRDPVQNVYPWTNLTNVVFIEYPIGVGFTQGESNVENAEGAAQQFLGFWRNFASAFCLENYKVYLAGASYAGYYIPYIADAFIDAADFIYFDLQGVFLTSPILGDQTSHGQTVTMDFVRHWETLLNLNSSFFEAMEAYSEYCGYEDYREEYLQFPAPQRPFPLQANPYGDEPRYACDIFDQVAWAALLVNPCFNIYRVSDQCPFRWSVLGAVNEADYVPLPDITYFDLSAVQEAIHVPPTDWRQCRDGVYRDIETGEPLSDSSSPPANNGVLQRVIDYTQNVVVGTGDQDFLLSPNGTLLAIQNCTFGGRQGLSEYPTQEFYVPYHPEPNQGSMAGAGILGTWTTDRGLTFFRLASAGHQIPAHAPGAAYRAVELMLGRIDSFSDVVPFTTLPGNWTGTMPLNTTEGEFVPPV